MARKYEQRVRAARQEETRQRIVDAAVELHGTIGPAATSLSAVAERAGVQRNTLYRHFPDERSLLLACSGHWFSHHPIPGTAGWEGITDPHERARRGLGELYAYFRGTQEMTANVLRDSEVSEVTRDTNALRVAAPLAAFAAAILSAWPRRTRDLEAAVALAMSFHTWQSLAQGSGLTDDEAAALQARMLGAAA